jgi:hypothetical protein
MAKFAFFGLSTAHDPLHSPQAAALFYAETHNTRNIGACMSVLSRSPFSWASVFRKVDPPTVRRQCKHIKDNGEQCRKNALPGKSYCDMASHRRAALLRTKLKNCGRRRWPVFIGVFTLAVGVPSLYNYATRISVAPFSTVRAHESMGTIFNVTNSGTFDLYNVTHECKVTMLRLGSDSIFDHNQVELPHASLGDLPAGATKSLDCEHFVVGLRGAASLKITVTFNSLLCPFKCTREFPFESEQADDGTWVWKAQ